MENIISYFGTYTPAADGAIANFKFEYLCTLGFAAIVIFTSDFRDQDDRHSQYQF